MDPGADEVPAARGVRTTRRRGRLTPAAVDALVHLGPAWSITGAARWTAAGLDTAFGRATPRLLDIGVGDGRATLAWAEAHPDRDVVAAEVHRPGVSRLLSVLAEGAHTNVRVTQEDATVVLDALEPGSIREVRILFPDPWPKRRHRERRLVDVRVVQRVADLLPPGGHLHIATDWEAYADHAREALATEPRFEPVVGAAGAGASWRSDRPPRPVTIYEGRAAAAGRAVTDLLVRRV